MTRVDSKSYMQYINVNRLNSNLKAVDDFVMSCLTKKEDKTIKIHTPKNYIAVPQTDHFCPISDILKRDSNIFIIVGCRGSGKSTLAFALGEHYYSKGRKVFAVGFPKDTPISYNVETIEEVEDGSVVIYDEAGIALNSKSTFNKKNMDIANLLKIARHKDLSLIFISQNSASISLDVVRLTDTLMLLKPSLLQSYTERAFMKKIYNKVEGVFDKNMEFGDVFVVDRKQELWFKFDKPSFWNENISKAYR